MNLKNLEEMMVIAGVPRSLRKKTLKELKERQIKEDSVSSKVQDMVGSPGNSIEGDPINPRVSERMVDDNEPRTYQSSFKKGQVVMFKGMKYRIEVPNAKADFVGIIPVDGGKVNLVRSNKLKLIEHKIPKTLDEIRIKIEAEVDYVDIKPYSHNIISMLLGMAAESYGNKAANDLIDEFDLAERGWSKEDVTENSKPVTSNKPVSKKKTECPQCGEMGQKHAKDCPHRRIFDQKTLKEVKDVEAYGTDNVKDLNKQVTSDELEKLGKQAEKSVSGDKVDTFATAADLEPDELTSDNSNAFGGTSVTVPQSILADLKTKIADLRKDAELVRTRDGANADWHDRTANFFDGLLTRLKTGNDENIKMASIEAQRVMSPIQHQLPSSVWDFFVRGGKLKSLSDHFKERKKK